MLQRIRTKDNRINIFKADCMDVMKKMKSNCVDSIITDGPYSLSKNGSAGGFMGKAWDARLPKLEYWQEMLRVAKPGAMLISFGAPRTFHRMACLIEDAGWELRDCICWLFGSGFPKSLDIGRAIDKAAGAERKIISATKSAGGNNFNAWRSGENRKDRPPAHCKHETVVTAPATDESALWEGYGTALKPGYEPIILAMKPLDGTFAQNALKWGVAGLNIDGCRVEGRERTKYGLANSKRTKKNTFGKPSESADFDSSKGRWPANVVLDEIAAKKLDDQTGVLKSGRLDRSKITAENKLFGKAPKARNGVYLEDSGGASRFFYCAKASPKERGKFNNHPTLKPLKLMEWLCLLTKTPKGGIVLDPFMGSGTTGLACINTNRKFVGIEREQDYFEIAKRRLREHIAKNRKRG